MKCEVNIPTKINKCCDSDNGRYALEGIQVVPSDQGVYLIATDSRKMVIVQSGGIADSKCIIPGDLAPKNKKEFTGTVRYYPNAEDETKPGCWTRLEHKTKLSQRSCEEMVNVRFPKVDYAVPEMTNRHMAVTFNPKYLLECWEAMGGDQTDGQPTITMLLEVPKTQSLLPDTDAIIGQIQKLRDGMSEEAWSKRFICLALNCSGDWMVDSYPDVNMFHEAVMGKYDYYNDILPEDLPFGDIAFKLIAPIRKQFEAKQLKVEKPIGLMANQNIGVLMPMSGGYEATDYTERRERFIKAYQNADNVEAIDGPQEATEDTEPEDEPEVVEEECEAQGEPKSQDEYDECEADESLETHLDDEEYLEEEYHEPYVVEMETSGDDIDLDALCEDFI